MTARRDWRFWALLALFLLIVALHLATPGLDSDQAVTGLMGLHVLRGEFPVFFWSQNHAGVPESYGAAVLFSVLGVSRLVLSLVPALAALGLVLVVYRTGALLFGHGAGLLAILFATIVSPYVAAHYVLARAYYIEQILAGHLVLLGAAFWLRHGSLPDRAAWSEPARTRALLAMGLSGGVGLYCGLQIVDALVPALLALLLMDPWLVLRRGAWMGLGALFLGSAPFWLYNLTRDWPTFAVAAQLQRGELSSGEALTYMLRGLLPVVLGVQPETRTPPYLPLPFALIVPLVVGAALGLLAVRVVRGGARLRRDHALAGEAMLLAAVVVTLGIVWYGRFVSAPRYLVPLAPVLALVLARAGQLVWRRSRVAAVVAAGLYLASVGIPLAGDLTLLWPARRAQYWAARAGDEALFAFLRSRELRHAYSFEYWLAPRLSFDAGEAIVVAQPFDDRYPPYTRAVDASTRPAYVLRGRTAALFENWLTGIGARAARARAGRYTVFWDFAPPPAAVALSRAGVRTETSGGVGDARGLLDGRLETGWTSPGSPPGSASILIDLGQARPVSGVTLVADRPEHLPDVLEVSVADGPTSGPPVGRLETRKLSVEWRNGAPRVIPGRTLTLRFDPVEARRIRLTEAGPAGTWGVSEVFILGPTDTSPPVIDPLEQAGRLEAAGELGPALARYRNAMTTAPDDPAGYAGFTRVTEAMGLVGAPPAARAARYARLGLLGEARATYAALAASLGSGLTHTDLTRERARLAALAGDPDEAGRLQAEVDAATVSRNQTRAVFGRLVELTAYDIAPVRARPGESLAVAAHWRLIESSGGPLVAAVSFRGERARFDDTSPLPAPIPGLGDGVQHVTERRRIAVPPGTPPGHYRVLVGVRDSVSGRSIRRWWTGLVPTTRHTVEVGTVEVLAPAS